MKQDKVKQVICIYADNPDDFQEKMNESLSHLSNPEITFFKDMPFYAIITYTVKRDMPEDMLELLEMIEGQSYTCEACPHFVRPEDKRKKWGSCSSSCQPTKADSRACETFYVHRYKILSDAKERYLEIPFKAE